MKKGLVVALATALLFGGCGNSAEQVTTTIEGNDTPITFSSSDETGVGTVEDEDNVDGTVESEEISISTEIITDEGDAVSTESSTVETGSDTTEDKVVTVELGDEIIVRSDSYKVEPIEGFDKYEGQVLVDEAGVKVTFNSLGFSTTSPEDVCMNATVENNTSEEIKINNYVGTVNGYVASVTFIKDGERHFSIAPGETVDGGFEFTAYSLEESRVAKVAEIGVSIEAASGPDVLFEKYVELKSDPHIEVDDSLADVGEEIYNDGNIRLEFIGTAKERESSENREMVLLLENMSDRNIVAAVNNFSVNGIECDKIFYDQVVPGAKLVGIQQIENVDDGVSAGDKIEEMVINVKVIDASGRFQEDWYDTGDIKVEFK